MGRVQCSDEFFIRCVVSKKKKTKKKKKEKKRKKDRKALFPLLVRFTF